MGELQQDSIDRRLSQTVGNARKRIEDTAPGGLKQEEWDRLPLRARMLINAGFVDVDEVMTGWRKHWKEEDGG